MLLADALGVDPSCQLLEDERSDDRSSPSLGAQPHSNE